MEINKLIDSNSNEENLIESEELQESREMSIREMEFHKNENFDYY